MSDWQPIETAPKDRRSKLVYCPGNKCCYVVFWDEKQGEWVHFAPIPSALTERPTHWMPLPTPSPPEEENG